MKRKRSYSSNYLNKRTKKVATPYGRPYYKNNSYNLYKSPRIGWPQEYTTTLSFSKQGVIPTAAGAATNYISFRSEAYDVDPVVGSTAMPGFAEFASLYARYRPLEMSYDFEASNKETFALQVMTGFTCPTLTPTSVLLLGNPHWKTKMISAKGGLDRSRIKDKVTMVELFGTKQALYDDIFTGSTQSATLATVGTTNAYFVILSPSVGIVNGVDYNITIRLKLTFYRPFALVI